MKRHNSIWPVLLAGLVLWLGACSQAEQEQKAATNLEAVDPQGQSVDFWYSYKGDRENAFLEMVANFNQTNPHGIQVKGEHIGNYNELYDKMLVGIQGGYLPQLTLAYRYQAEAYYRSKGVVDLNPYINSPKWGLAQSEKEDLSPTFIAQDNIDGTQLAILPSRSMEILYYNASWLAELGHDGPPRNWDEFAQMCRQAGKQPYSKSLDQSRSQGFLLNIDASRLAAMVFSRGGDLLAADGNTYTIDTSQARAALSLLQELQAGGSVALLQDTAADKDAFGKGQLLFAIHSSSRLPFFINNVKAQAGFDWDVAALPYEGDRPVQNVYGGSIALCRSTPEQQLASWLFIKWFIEPAQQERWSKGSNYFPVSQSTARSLSPYFRTAYDLLAYGKNEPTKIGYENVRLMIEEAMREIMQGADVAEALARVEKAANEPLKN